MLGALNQASNFIVYAAESFICDGMLSFHPVDIQAQTGSKTACLIAKLT
jgi:hypothetical protein